MSLYSNVLNSMVMFTFLLCTQNASSWANFGPRKNKITFIRWHLGPRLIEYVKFDGDVEFFAEHRKYCFIDKLGTKFQDYFWKVKFYTQSNSSVRNLMMKFILLFCFGLGIPLFEKLWLICQICLVCQVFVWIYKFDCIQCLF